MGRFAPDALTALAASWATRPFWAPGRYVAGFDTYAYSGPNVAVSERAFRRGSIALWNDQIFGGVPHLGNPQAGTLYLPKLVVTWALENNRAMGVLVALHVIWLGLGMVRLARRFVLGAVASTFAGTASVLSGIVLTKATQFEQILVLAWAPWLFASILLVFQGDRPTRAAGFTAATTAAILVSGHPQMAYETAAMAAALAGAATLWTRRWRGVGWVGLGAGVGVLMSAPQLWAALVTTSASTLSAGRDPRELSSSSLVLAPSYAARAIFGFVGARDPARVAGRFEAIVYLGVATVLLAVIGGIAAVRDRHDRRWAVPLMMFAAIGFVWSFGPRTVVFDLANAVLPGFDLARGSARWMVVVGLITILFAAHGVDRVRRVPGPSHLVVAATTVGVLGTLVALLGLDDRDSALRWHWGAVGVGVVLAAGAGVKESTRLRRAGSCLLVAIAALELTALALHAVPFVDETSAPFTSMGTGTTRWLASREGGVITLTDETSDPTYGVPGMRPNANVLAGVGSIDGYDGGVQVTSRWAAALARFGAHPDDTLPLRNNLAIPLDPHQLARLGVRFLLIDGGRPVAQLAPAWRGPVAEDERFAVYENPAWIGLATAVTETVLVRPADVPTLLRQDAERWADVAFVDEAPRLPGGGPRLPRAPVIISRVNPEHVELDVTSDHRRLVVVAQQFDDGWNGWLDGEPISPILTDGLFLGFDVPAGHHRLVLRYRPSWLTPSLAVGALASLACLALIVGRPPSRRKRGEGVAPSPRS